MTQTTTINHISKFHAEYVLKDTPPIIAPNIQLPNGKCVQIKEILTTNPHKLEEFRAAGLQLDELNLSSEVTEIQAIKCERLWDRNFQVREQVYLEVAAAKAKEAYRQAGRPVLVEDSNLYVACMGALIGPYTKNWGTPEGLQLICHARTIHGNLTASAITVLAVSDGTDNGTLTWIGAVPGHIAEEPRGEKDFGFGPIFIPEPDKQIKISFNGRAYTWGEMPKEDKLRFFPMRRVVVDSFRKSIVYPADESRELTALILPT